MAHPLTPDAPRPPARRPIGLGVFALLALSPLVGVTPPEALPVGRGAATLAAQEAPHGGTRHLHGIVEDSVTGRALDEAEVVVAGRTVQRVRTDGRGRFDLRDLPSERVTVRARHVGYVPWEQVVDLTRGDALLVIHLMPATVTLERVAVRADTLADALARVAATTTLDAAALAERRGQTLGETIKHLPGVSVIQFGPSVAKPVIRGLNSQRVLVMNSGLRQEDQQWGTEHAPNIDGFDADAVTVVRGAATVLYGPDAIGGVVRVDRAAAPAAGAPRGGDVALNGFSNSRQGALSVGAHGGGLPLPGLGAVGYRLRLTGRMAGNAGSPDYFLSNTGFREVNGSAALGVTRGRARTELLVSRFGTELGVLRQAHAGTLDDLQRAMTTAPRDSAFSYAIGRPNQRVAHTTARVRSSWALRDDSELEAVYGFQYNQRREYDNHGPLRFRDTPAFHLKLFTNSLDVRWRHAAVRGVRGTVGASVLQQGNQTLGKGFLIPGYDLGQGAVYAQEEWSAGRLTLSAGARGDVIRQATLPYADLGIRSPAGTRTWSGVSGSLGGAYWLRNTLSASLRVARAWRPPTVNERYAQGVHHGTAQYELGDATLDPERSLGVEASLRHAGERLLLEAAAYSNRIDGFIYLQPSTPVVTIRGVFPGFDYAQTAARLRGLELAARWTPRDWLELSATGNAVRGDDRTHGGPLFDMPADRALVQARLTGRREWLGRWHAGAGTVLVRRQDRVPEGTVYSLPTAGYALVTLDVGSTEFRLGGRTLDLSLSVTNALDTRYRDYLSRYRLFVDDAGRDLVLRVRAPF